MKEELHALTARLSEMILYELNHPAMQYKMGSAITAGQQEKIEWLTQILSTVLHGNLKPFQKRTMKIYKHKRPDKFFFDPQVFSVTVPANQKLEQIEL